MGVGGGVVVGGELWGSRLTRCMCNLFFKKYNLEVLQENFVVLLKLIVRAFCKLCWVMVRSVQEIG